MERKNAWSRKAWAQITYVLDNQLSNLLRKCYQCNWSVNENYELECYQMIERWRPKKGNQIWNSIEASKNSRCCIFRYNWYIYEIYDFQERDKYYRNIISHSWGPARQRLNPGTGTRYWYCLPANIPFLSVPLYSNISMMVPKSNPLSGSSEQLLEEGDQHRKKSADQDKCNWNYVSGEVVWYLTTDGTGALPILCLLFLLVPFGAMLALKIAGRLWRFLQTPGWWKLSP